MKILSFVFILFTFHSFGQTSRYSKPPQVYVQSTDMGLGNVTRALEQANTRAESNHNQIQPLMDLNLEILKDKIKAGCDNRIIDFYNSNMQAFEKRGYSLGSSQDVASLKSELNRLRSALVTFDCSKPTPQLKNEVSVSQSNANAINYQSINRKGTVINNYTTIWSDSEIYKANKIGELNKNDEVNITGLYINGISEVYQVILANGKSGYINKINISLK